MKDWEPDNLHRDPMVNAVLNVASALYSLAEATDGLLYGLKYGHGQVGGRSIAESIEVAMDGATERISEAISEIGRSLVQP